MGRGRQRKRGRIVTFSNEFGRISASPISIKIRENRCMREILHTKKASGREGEEEEERPEKRSERRGEPAKWLDWSLSETPMARGHFPPLVSRCYLVCRPNPPSLSDLFRLIHLHESAVSVNGGRGEGEGKERTGCISP